MTKHTHNFSNSTSISCCEYDDETKEMHITFVSGGKHKYQNVDAEHFHGFKSSDSPGKHFHSSIRKVYKGEKVED